MTDFGVAMADEKIFGAEAKNFADCSVNTFIRPTDGLLRFSVGEMGEHGGVMQVIIEKKGVQDDVIRSPLLLAMQGTVTLVFFSFLFISTVESVSSGATRLIFFSTSVLQSPRERKEKNIGKCLDSNWIVYHFFSH